MKLVSTFTLESCIYNKLFMESISTFDMLKIGVGPSSSHTLGPWRAAEKWIKELHANENFIDVVEINVSIYGSLSLTGKGHATDYAVMLGLSGQDPEYIPIEHISSIVKRIKEEQKIEFDGKLTLSFNPDKNIIFKKEFLPFHANGMTFEALLNTGKKIKNTYYSIGGGFVVKEERKRAKKNLEIFKAFPFPVTNGVELLAFCAKEQKTVSEIVLENERSLRTDAEIDHELHRIWDTMLECMYTGCHTEGSLPGGLNVRRRAFDMHLKLKDSEP